MIAPECLRVVRVFCGCWPEWRFRRQSLVWKAASPFQTMMIFVIYFTLTSSISNTSRAFGGIPGRPRSP